jgi:hypothetical protein
MKSVRDIFQPSKFQNQATEKGGGRNESHWTYTSDLLFLLATFIVCTGISVKLFRWESA